MKRALVAGATGYLGQYLVKELKSRNIWVKVLIRNEKQKSMFKDVDEFIIGQITNPEDIGGICDQIDIVFSTIGITRQKDNLTYMDVDYQANSNLLDEAKKSNIDAFLYVSAINGDKMKNLKIFEAKEKFVDLLKASGIPSTIMRPNGFFSDMSDFLDMAKGGRVYLFGHGNYQLNPIHGEDLAKVCVDKLLTNSPEVNVGGPHMFTQNELAKLALYAWDKPIKITHLPDWTRLFTIWFMRTFTSSKTYGPYEFFLTAMGSDNIAESFGDQQLKTYFEQIVKKEQNGEN